MSDTGQPPDTAIARKAALRARALAARRALPDPVRAAAALRVQAALRAVLVGSAIGTVAGYQPFGAEPGGPDLPAVLAGWLPPGGRLLLPVVRPDRSLDWTRYRSGTVPSPTNPPGPRLGVSAIGSVGLVVVPALAVDRRGVRLGRGGGAYDRALALLAPGTEVVALLHDGELVDGHLPAEPHDRRVTAVITPALGLVPVRAAAGWG